MCHCVACRVSKAKRPNMEKAKDLERHQNTAVLTHFASDINGPTQFVSFSGMRYTVVFVCLRTRWTAVYFMRTKDELLSCFEQFVTAARRMGKNEGIPPHFPHG